MILKKIKNHYAKEKRNKISFLPASISLVKKALRKFYKREVPTTGDVYEGFRLYKKPLLITYSRSGTNWIRYFIEITTGKPTPGQKRVLTGNDYFIDRAHAGYIYAEKYKSLLLILRNYKECLVRHHGIETIRKYDSVKSFLQDEKIEQPATWYSNNIKSYHDFKGEKLLVYYEDLISNPEDNLRSIADFLNLPLNEVNQFIEKLDTHKMKSVNAYTKFGHKSETQGDPKKLSHHSQELTPEETLAFDIFFKESDPTLFSEYLSRYRS